MKIKTGKFLIGKKINIVLILNVLLLFVTIAIPSFCMLLIKDNSNEIDYWDGSIATSYKSGDGSETNPYIISDANELAYFSQEINNGNSYDGKYFEITNNIHLNNGVIEYKNNLIIYTKDSIKYYVKPFTNEYYKESTFNTKVGTINIFSEMKTFRGNINGNDNFIYGLYLTNETDEKLSFIETHNNGQIKNLYFSNALIYGNYSVGLINSTQNGTYNNLIFNGSIYSTGKDKVIPYNVDDIVTNGNTNNINFTFGSYQLPELSEQTKISLTGISSGNEIYIDNQLINQGEFEIEYEEIPTKITIKSKTIDDVLSNLVIGVYYNDSIVSLINNLENSRINNTFVRGNIYGKYITSPLIGYVTNNIELNNCFNDANIYGKYITSGFIGVMKNASINSGNIYNSGNVNGEVISGGIFGAIYSSYNINLHDSFNVGNIVATTKGAIVGTSEINLIDHNNFYINQDMSSVGNSQNIIATYIEKNNLLQTTFLTSTLKFNNTTWNVSENELPKLITFDNEEPTLTIKLLDNTWTNINTKEIKITQTTWLDITYEDLQSDILKVEYYISDKIINEEEIKNIDFELYNENIFLEENGNYYIIFKTTDVVGNVNITTTDLINLDGYNLTISDIYNNTLKKYNNQISYESGIKYNFTRTYKMETFIYPTDISYMLKTNILLPNNTNIKLIDNINNKVYLYIVNNDEVSYINNSYLYNLSLFKEIGNITDQYFNNKVINYYKNECIKENYEVILEFKNTTIDKNENVTIDLVTIFENTIYSSTYTNLNNAFKLIKYDENDKEVSYSFNTTTNYQDYIDMSVLNTYDINITNETIRSQINNVDIYNENIDENRLYLLIKIYDSNEKLVIGNLINSLSVEYNDNIYYSNNSGYIKIPFENNNINLKLNVNYIINDVVNGLYYLKINTCNNIGICGNEEIIPIKISNNISNVDCDFTIYIDAKDRLISRNNGLNLNNNNYMNTTINYNGTLSNPNIRIKLYKKLNFDSNNQVYELIDLSQYVSNNFELIKDYQYYLIKDVTNNQNININYIINNFNYGGYKLVFELYDGESFVKEESTTFIIK